MPSSWSEKEPAQALPSVSPSLTRLAPTASSLSILRLQSLAWSKASVKWSSTGTLPLSLPPSRTSFSVIISGSAVGLAESPRPCIISIVRSWSTLKKKPKTRSKLSKSSRVGWRVPSTRRTWGSSLTLLWGGQILLASWDSSSPSTRWWLVPLFLLLKGTLRIEIFFKL